MATPLGWSKAGSGSVCLAFDQLRDVIESQEELIHQLRNVMVLQDENFVSKEEFQAVEKKLVEAETGELLEPGRQRLQRAEIVPLHSNLGNKSKTPSQKKKKNIESHIIKQEDILNGKENEIKELQQVISQQKQIFRNHMSDFRIQKQQESYMAQVLDQKHKKASGTRQAHSHQHPREK
uniref:Spermatosis associated 24 n=1 Tax=Mandrillus leucophaeus TaxID=9568 RepID=A0A2K5YZ89_MANLE